MNARERWPVWAGIAGGALLFAWMTMLLIFVPPAWVSWTTGLAGLALLGAYAAVNRAALVRTALSPQLRYGSNALLFTAAVVAIAALLNVVATRHSARADLTANRFFSLSDQTRKVLKSLNRKVKVTAFFKSGSKEMNQLRDLLKEYRHVSSQLEVEFVDPDQKPARAQIYKITAMNTTILESGAKRKDILPHELFGYQFQGRQPQQEFKGESVITAGLLSVSSDKQLTVYFLEGHGERSIEDSGENGLSALKQQLERDNYVVKSVNLVREGKLPADAELIVVAGPRRVVPEPERKVLEAHLAKEGKLLVLLDLDTSAGLEPLLTAWGVTPLTGMVVDPRSYYYFGGPFVPIPAYKYHKITTDLQKQNVGSVFPGTRARAAGKIEGATGDAL
ncbi:MAG: GldG family protein, partial [bacterium]